MYKVIYENNVVEFDNLNLALAHAKTLNIFVKIQGDEYEIKVHVENGHINIYLNGTLKCAFPKKAKGCYFKIGCYTQSNPSKGAKPGEYAEVILKALSLYHHE